METMTNDEIMIGLSENEKEFIDFLQYYGEKSGEAKSLQTTIERFYGSTVDESHLFYVESGRCVSVNELKSKLLEKVDKYARTKDSLLAKLKSNGAVLVCDSPFQYMEVDNHLPDPLEGEDFEA